MEGLGYAHLSSPEMWTRPPLTHHCLGCCLILVGQVVSMYEIFVRVPYFPSHALLPAWGSWGNLHFLVSIVSVVLVVRWRDTSGSSEYQFLPGRLSSSSRAIAFFASCGLVSGKGRFRLAWPLLPGTSHFHCCLSLRPLILIVAKAAKPQAV